MLAGDEEGEVAQEPELESPRAASGRRTACLLEGGGPAPGSPSQGSDDPLRHVFAWGSVVSFGHKNNISCKALPRRRRGLA